jgi:hypothetical protein
MTRQSRNTRERDCFNKLVHTYFKHLNTLRLYHTLRLYQLALQELHIEMPCSFLYGRN